MTKLKIIVVAAAMMSLFACNKGQKHDTPTAEAPVAPATDTDIQAKDLNLDAGNTSDSGKIDGLYTLNFEFDKSTLTPEARDKAQKDAEWLKAHPSTNVQIEGHCDRIGSIEYNLALGERRANSVKKYLLTLGVDGTKLTTISYGKEHLLDLAETAAADAKNRRANFRLVSAPVETHKM